jgi:hypothetical protein
MAVKRHEMPRSGPAGMVTPRLEARSSLQFPICGGIYGYPIERSVRPRTFVPDYRNRNTGANVACLGLHVSGLNEINTLNTSHSRSFQSSDAS